VQAANHDALGLIVDSFHTLAVADNASGIAECQSINCFFVQLADAPKLTMDALSWSRHFRNFPGRANCQWLNSCALLWQQAIATAIAGSIQRRVPRSAGRLIARDGLRSLLLSNRKPV